MSCDEDCDKSYCRKHNPKVARITSINSRDLDRSLKELDPPHLARSVMDRDGNPIDGRGNPIPPSITTSDGTSEITIRPPGKEIFRVVDTKEELPETGTTEGQLVLVQDEGSLYIWDGEEWSNLGDVARELRTMRNNAYNRRAEAIAASRKKREERGIHHSE